MKNIPKKFKPRYYGKICYNCEDLKDCKKLQLGLAFQCKKYNNRVKLDITGDWIL